MRILYIDIDSLRPDHLGCYGYHRDTSPNIDTVAANATRFTNVFVTDAPCLPSRSALWSGQFGYRTGVIDHGGTAGQPFVEGPGRGFRDRFGTNGWMACLRRAGFHTATVSPFGERHTAWHWYAGYNEMINTGKGGTERADEIAPPALDWLERKGRGDNWFLHVNFWDPHTPYQAPLDFGDPFKDDPLPAWLTEEVRQKMWSSFGPHSTQEPGHWDVADPDGRFPRMPRQLSDMDQVKKWMDGHDTGIRYADHYIGQLLNKLDDLGIKDETAVIISADHGENQGELNVWGDHQLADAITCRVPLIVHWPGITDAPKEENGLHYHFDFAATLIELVGGQVPDDWDGESFALAFEAGEETGRDYLVTSQAPWSCQRGVMFENYQCLRTYHDGYKALDPVMLFDRGNDFHQQVNLVDEKPEVVNQAMAHLADWQEDMMLKSRTGVDPMVTVMNEGGPFHCRGQLPRYCEWLRETDREHHADYLEAIHPDEC